MALIDRQPADIDTIAEHLASLLSTFGPKRIALPGGSTPFPILAELVNQDIGWDRIGIWPTDDRCVPETHEASNVGRLQRVLLPTGAVVHALDEGMEPPPFDLVWLGMGEDGHVASLFPSSDPQADAPLTVQRLTPDPLPPEAPFDRLTLTLPALARSRAMMLVVKGDTKRAVLDDALAGRNDLPVRRLIDLYTGPLTIFWSQA